MFFIVAVDIFFKSQCILFGCCIRCYFDVAIAFFVCVSSFLLLQHIISFVALYVF